jgi:SAM-dependent methyltransferase
VSETTFTGERLHRGDDLFAVDLARHEAAYAFARPHATRGRILDLGCGSGYGTRALVGSADMVVGLDRVRPDVASRSDGTNFLRAELPGLPLSPRAFDLIVSFQVIEHFEDPTDYVDALSDPLREDGLAIVTTPNLLMSDGVNPYHVHEYLADELAECLGHRFGEVEMLGVGASALTRAHFEARSRRIRRVMRLDPLGLRDHLPRPLIEWLFARFALLVRRRTSAAELAPEVSVDDFPVGPVDDGCLDLLALCRHPR